MRSPLCHLTVPAILVALVGVGLGACGGGDDESSRSGDLVAEDRPLAAADAKEVRRAVIGGAVRDFDAAADGPGDFVGCFVSRFSRRLSRERLEQLVAIRASHGEPRAARALNAIGVPVGDACGGRRWVPQLVAAAHGLSEPDTTVVDQRPAEPAATVAECPVKIRISARPVCKLVGRRTELISCPHPRVGDEVRVAGITCREAYGLLTPLGAAARIGFIKEDRQKLTRPAVATYHRPFQIRDTGWTCWSAFAPELGIQFVCWRGSDVLTFRFL